MTLVIEKLIEWLPGMTADLAYLPIDRASFQILRLLKAKSHESYCYHHGYSYRNSCTTKFCYVRNMGFIDLWRNHRT